MNWKNLKPILARDYLYKRDICCHTADAFPFLKLIPSFSYFCFYLAVFEKHHNLNSRRGKNTVSVSGTEHIVEGRLQEGRRGHFWTALEINFHLKIWKWKSVSIWKSVTLPFLWAEICFLSVRTFLNEFPTCFVVVIANTLFKTHKHTDTPSFFRYRKGKVTQQYTQLFVVWVATDQHSVHKREQDVVLNPSAIHRDKVGFNWRRDGGQIDWFLSLC